MIKRTTTVVRQRTEGQPSRLVQVSYVWPCFNNCGNLVMVAPTVHKMLQTNQLTGVACGGCLEPPQSGMLTPSRIAA